MNYRPIPLKSHSSSSFLPKSGKGVHHAISNGCNNAATRAGARVVNATSTCTLSRSNAPIVVSCALAPNQIANHVLVDKTPTIDGCSYLQSRLEMPVNNTPHHSFDKMRPHFIRHNHNRVNCSGNTPTYPHPPPSSSRRSQHSLQRVSCLLIFITLAFTTVVYSNYTEQFRLQTSQYLQGSFVAPTTTMIGKTTTDNDDEQHQHSIPLVPPSPSSLSPSSPPSALEKPMPLNAHSVTATNRSVSVQAPPSPHDSDMKTQARFLRDEFLSAAHTDSVCEDLINMIRFRVGTSNVEYMKTNDPLNYLSSSMGSAVQIYANGMISPYFDHVPGAVSQGHRIAQTLRRCSRTNDAPLLSSTNSNQTCAAFGITFLMRCKPNQNEEEHLWCWLKASEGCVASAQARVRASPSFERLRSDWVLWCTVATLQQ